MPDGGGLRVGLHWIKKGPWWAVQKNPTDMYDLVFEDTGTGIVAEQLETIFRPFFTTKPGEVMGWDFRRSAYCG